MAYLICTYVPEHGEPERRRCHWTDEGRTLVVTSRSESIRLPLADPTAYAGCYIYGDVTRDHASIDAPLMNSMIRGSGYRLPNGTP